jgi:hypothetical protein
MRAKLLAFALSFPEAAEDHPWNETVAKVGKKVFVFCGSDPRRPRITVKLVESHGHALSIDGAEPSGYGLGKPVGSPFPSTPQGSITPFFATGSRRATESSRRDGS